MSYLIIDRDDFSTISEMRREIARAVAKLHGDDLLTYRFQYRIGNTVHAARTGYLETRTECDGDRYHIPHTVSEMRLRLARVLPRLPGDYFARFKFHCVVSVPERA